MALTGQLAALLGVVLGAVVSMAATMVVERARWRREQSVRWDERRLNAYADYAHAVKSLAHQYRRIAVARGITASGAAPLEPTDEVLAEVAEAEVRRSALAETVWLLGDVGTNTAAVRLNHCLWHLEWLARELPTAGQDGWDQAYEEFRQARLQFLRLARAGLGVRGARIAEPLPWPPPWRGDLSRGTPQ
ncbi:hypothetical protein AB0K92_18040 [Streptomyces sp. NPDC052687]|uniref:hypothetical protein n=1 Tax=Streptomyces sp. NPDC052687 TaxID=3154759 RepID=UPI00343FA909